MTTLAGFFSDDSFYWWMAIVGTALFVGKLLLSLIAGSIGGDAEFDLGDAADAADAGDALDGMDGAEIDIEHDSGAAFTVFSIQSILAFFMAMGWMGLACLNEWDLSPMLSLVIATSFGLLIMMLNAWLMFQVRKLNKVGGYDLNTAVGRLGQVYLQIPEKGKGSGKVRVSVSGQQMIVRATSEGPAIPSFAEVRIVRLKDNQEFVVAPDRDDEPDT